MAELIMEDPTKPIEDYINQAWDNPGDLYDSTLNYPSDQIFAKHTKDEIRQIPLEKAADYSRNKASLEWQKQKLTNLQVEAKLSLSKLRKTTTSA
jgi:hypothetical protein